MYILNEKQIEYVAGGNGAWLGDWLCVCSSGYPHVVLSDEEKNSCVTFCCGEQPNEAGGHMSKIVYFNFPINDIDPDTTQSFYCNSASKHSVSRSGAIARSVFASGMVGSI